ncbi:hypothetical protein FRB91_000159 [Serendipita sp. 411]|nr:hypothetical protein FRB91_000159 [Serendipita sp. 411]
MIDYRATSSRDISPVQGEEEEEEHEAFLTSSLPGQCYADGCHQCSNISTTTSIHNNRQYSSSTMHSKTVITDRDIKKDFSCIRIVVGRALPPILKMAGA